MDWRLWLCMSYPATGVIGKLDRSLPSKSLRYSPNVAWMHTRCIALQFYVPWLSCNPAGLNMSWAHSIYSKLQESVITAKSMKQQFLVVKQCGNKTLRRRPAQRRNVRGVCRRHVRLKAMGGQLILVATLQGLAVPMLNLRRWISSLACSTIVPVSVLLFLAKTIEKLLELFQAHSSKLLLPWLLPTSSRLFNQHDR